MFLEVALGCKEIPALFVWYAGVLLLDSGQGFLNVPIESVNLASPIHLLVPILYLFQKQVPFLSENQNSVIFQWNITVDRIIFKFMNPSFTKNE